MALNQVVGTGSLFSQAWVDGLKHVPEAGMNCEIRIERYTGDMNYDPETNTYNPVVQVLFDGNARVQPRRSASQQPIPGNSTTKQMVQFQIPIDKYTFDLKADSDQVLVTKAPLNDRLPGYVYVVSEVIDSGNPIEYTFLCSVDQEARRGN